MWETHARVVVDFTPGAGMLWRTALMMSAKAIAIVHNDKHMKAIKSILKKYVVDDYVVNGTSTKFATPGMQDAITDKKPKRLIKWEGQRKRPGDETDGTPDAKRTTLAAQCDAMLTFLDSPADVKAKAKAKPESKAKAPTGAGETTPEPKTNLAKAGSSDTPVTPQGTGTAGAASSASATVAGPTDDLQALLGMCTK